MKTVFLIVLITLLLVVPAIAVDWITNHENRHKYSVVPAGANWNEAEQNAIAIGGQLASINDEQENAFVLSIQRDQYANFMWIGLYEIDYSQRTWTWVSGESLTYQNWAPGEPNGQGAEHWVAMDGYGGWVDLMNTWPDGSGYKQIALAEAIPEPSSLLALGGGLVGIIGIKKRKNSA